MPDATPEVLTARQEAAQARLERDLLLTLHQAEVRDVEVAMLLVERKLAADTSDPAGPPPDRTRIESALREVLDERPHLGKTSQAAPPARGLAPVLPGPLPIQAPERPSLQAARREALERARTSRSAGDLAEYLRLRRLRK